MPEYQNVNEEVDFHKYCPLCKNHKKKDSEEPCHTCLRFPVRQFSKKPLKFVEKE